ncbi:putative FBD-associated F-box protein [Cardamine amara subsp. amara]|uniref:FBD-associated F-box protein n=1 Tax=Cardamine amara subsp. amara TaxID=228776 RepID=A0ABD0ZWY8_CARAN
MPELVEANVKLVCERPEKLMRSITSVKCLSLCLYGSMLEHRIEFDQLVQLELCECSPDWWDLLTWMLENSPKLQVLKLNNCKERFYCFVKDIVGRWREPSCVPECLMYHLNTFEWKCYNGEPEEKRVVAYILKNATELKTLAISAAKLYQWEITRGQREELVALPRASSSCQLLVD